MIYKKVEGFFTVIPYRDIYKRLGKSDFNSNSDFVEENFQKWIREAFLLCEVKAAYSIFQIDSLDKEFVEFNDYKISSENLSKFLSGCQYVCLMGLTVGKLVVDARDEQMENNPAKGVVFDATASETTDNALDKLQKIISVTYSRSLGNLLKARFSPGYGDLGIESQKNIYDILNLSTIGIDISDNFFMKPEKSVTAFSGFKRG